MNHDHHEMVESESSVGEYVKFAGVIAGIFALTTLMYVVLDGEATKDAMRFFMAAFMGTFAAFKLVGYKNFVAMFPGYDLVARRSMLYAKLFPFIELTLAGMYLFDVLPLLRNSATAAIAIVSAAGVYGAVYRKQAVIKCACLGNIIKLPLSTVSLVEDLVMFVMAIAMIAIGL